MTETSADEGTRQSDRTGVLWVTPSEDFVPFEQDLVFGREPGRGVRLESQRISRQHARVKRDGPLWLLEDLDSKNGTYVNASRAPLTPLNDQDIIRLGEWVGVVVAIPRQQLPFTKLMHELCSGWWVGARSRERWRGVGALARTTLPVVLTGETGTGKEVLARALHQMSGRPGRLIALNCAAVPDTVAEAQLFGHIKGAFTGAHKDAGGLLAAADGGTLFLDEIVDLAPPIQAKLLRALEERVVTPLGSTHSRRVDFRLLAATQEPLEGLVARGAFRPDLYARIAGAELELQPLRERREEILPLFKRTVERLRKGPVCLSAALIERLLIHDYPYNVRELVQLAGLFAIPEKADFGVHDLPERFRGAHDQQRSPGPALAPTQNTVSDRRQAWKLRHAHELSALKAALLETSGNVSEAARLAGVPRYRALRLLAADAEKE